MHSDRLRSGAERQLEIDFELILNVKGYILLDHFFEAGLFDLEAIAARREIRQIVFTRSVGCGFVSKICVGVDSHDFGIDDHRSGRIGDAAREGSVCGLRAEERRQDKKAHNREHRSASTRLGHTSPPE